VKDYKSFQIHKQTTLTTQVREGNEARFISKTSHRIYPDGETSMLNHFCVITSELLFCCCFWLSETSYLQDVHVEIFRQILFYDCSDSYTKNLLHKSGEAI